MHCVVIVCVLVRSRTAVHALYKGKRVEVRRYQGPRTLDANPTQVGIVSDHT
jgi:hypothetical protein